ALICVIYLLSIYPSLSEKIKVFLILLSAFQVAIFMTVVSLTSVSILFKIIFNSYYLLIPALVLYELNKKR
ncbi:hypothetical protein, partial [Pasteurella bettyae]